MKISILQPSMPFLFWSAFLWLAFDPGTIRAQSNESAQESPPPLDFKSGESSLLAGTPHPSLLSDFKVEGYDYLEASLTVEEKGASLTWAPFLLPRQGGGHYSFWSESRLQLSQKDDVTSLGFSLKYNPLNPLSTNGKNKWTEYWEGVKKEAPHGTPSQGLTVARRLRQKHLKSQEFHQLTLQANTCRPGLMTELDELQKRIHDAGGAPVSGALANDIACVLLELDSARKDLEIEIGNLQFVEEYRDENLIRQKKQQLGRWSQAISTLLPAAERAYFQQADRHQPTQLMAIRAEIAELDNLIEGSLSSDAAASDLGYRELLYASRKPIVNLSYINSFFNVISGGEVDTDDDELNDNEHRTKSRSLALSLDWQLGLRDGLSLLVSRSHERSSAEEGAPAADYNGFGATWSHVLTVLNREGYRKSKEYRESLFVPSIVFGIAYETKECDGPDTDCGQGILRTQALTPFIDFKIKKSAQFRIGIPFKRNRVFREGGQTDEDSIDLISLVALQLGAPN